MYLSLKLILMLYSRLTSSPAGFVKCVLSKLMNQIRDKNYLIAAIAIGDAIKVNTGKGRRANRVKLLVVACSSEVKSL